MAQWADPVGPWGANYRQMFNGTNTLNAAFSQHAWEDARQDKCRRPPGQSYPSFPPASFGFLYPSLQKNEQTTLGNCRPEYMESPWASNAPNPNWGNMTQFSSTAVSGPPAMAAPAYGPQLPLDISKYMPEKYLLPKSAYFPDAPQNEVLESFPNVRSAASFRPILPQMVMPGNSDAYAKDSNDNNDCGENVCRLTSRHFSWLNTGKCISNSFFGIFYDFWHWSELPANGVLGKVSYIFGRDDRVLYLIILFLLVTLIIVIFHKSKAVPPRGNVTSFPTRAPSVNPNPNPYPPGSGRLYWRSPRSIF